MALTDRDRTCRSREDRRPPASADNGMLSDYQQQLRVKLLAAPVAAPPDPWRYLNPIPVGGLQGVGFGVHPQTGDDLLMVVSLDGFGLFDATTGGKTARDRHPDPDGASPSGPDLACPGIGVLAGTRVRIAGLFGGGLHATTDDGWTIDVVAPEWPNHRVLLSADGGACDGPPGTTWWHVFHADHSELRAAGFSPSGRTLVIATSSDVTYRPPRAHDTLRLYAWPYSGHGGAVWAGVRWPRRQAARTPCI
ncbi:hypothetical protein AB0H63_03525 [Micromonospora echinospora]|uniref:hypothetical protein n=1 Tax=Micromonospora echinospora TaxID=1877 RepID=UPI003407BC08